LPTPTTTPGPLAARVPRYWSLRMLGEGKARRVVFFAGVTLLVGATDVFEVVGHIVTPEF